jgi:hypothetical protein
MNDNETIGTIYKISSPNTNQVYIGSTILTLKKRFTAHKTTFKRNITVCKSHIILTAGDAVITELMTLKGVSRKELLAKEYEFMYVFRDMVVNAYGINKHMDSERKRKRPKQ